MATLAGFFRFAGVPDFEEASTVLSEWGPQCIMMRQL